MDDKSNHDNFLLIIFRSKQFAVTRFPKTAPVSSKKYCELAISARFFLSRVFNKRLAKTRLGGGGKIINPDNSLPPMSCPEVHNRPSDPAPSAIPLALRKKAWA
jgi:hypothetical protein